MNISESPTFEARAAEVLTRVFAEMVRARRIHPPYHSLHEAYAVLLEETDEMWAEIKGNTDRVEEEAVQVAAVAMALLIDCFGERVEWPTAAPPMSRVTPLAPATGESAS
jgi:hypothetical protein